MIDDYVLRIVHLRIGPLDINVANLFFGVRHHCFSSHLSSSSRSEGSWGVAVRYAVRKMRGLQYIGAGLQYIGAPKFYIQDSGKE